MKVLEPPLDRISREAREYPAYLLRQGGTGLCLFAARFYGVNDAVHMARAEMTLTLVDTSDRVLEMAGMYKCSAHCVDAWAFAQMAQRNAWEWDAVSVDTYTGDATTLSLSDLGLWCDLARDVVTCTYVAGQPYTVPEGWTAQRFPRNEKHGIYWLVLTRD